MTFFRNITEILPHVNFGCVVNGTALSASVTHKEENGVQTYYLVSFSDGHQGLYVPGDAPVQDGFGCTRHLDAYEEAVYDDLYVIPLLTTGDRYAVIAAGEKESPDGFNVWVRKRNDFYRVFYKGRYQFGLCKCNGWWLVGEPGRKGGVVNYQMARFVSAYLALHPL